MKNIMAEIREFHRAVLDHESWFYLSVKDIESRYRRTRIGPWWVVIANFINIIGLALIGSVIFKTPIQSYLPYVAAGMITWLLVSQTITESTLIFTQYSSYIKNLNKSMYSYVLRVLSRIIIVFFHNFILYVGIIIILGVKINSNMLWIFLTFPMLVGCLINFSIIFSLIGVRFRDFAHIVTTALPMLVFVTPIMWRPERLGNKEFLFYMNPIAHLVMIIKDPLLGVSMNLISFFAVFIMLVLSFFISFYMMSKYKYRVAYLV